MDFQKNMLKRILRSLRYRAMEKINLRRSWKTDRQIVVIESDDWGSIRIPSKEAVERLMSKGVHLEPHAGYDRVDRLESAEDLSLLSEVLLSVKDRKGAPAKITMNYVMANPDFEKIRESRFEEYHYERFVETNKRYSGCEHSFQTLEKGIEEGVFQPQFHGREHLNVQRWLEALQRGDRDALEAFDEEMFAIYHLCKQSGSWQHYLTALDMATQEEWLFIQNSLREGLQIFRELFGFESKTMIAPCYTWGRAVEEEVARHGVQGMQGENQQKIPAIEGAKTLFRYTGECNEFGQRYLRRNCFFEPTQNIRLGREYALKGIERAFHSKTAAIISSHRLNFMGEIDPSHREKNLCDFKSLLKEVVSRWPAVEWMSSDELLKEMEH